MPLDENVSFLIKCYSLQNMHSQSFQIASVLWALLCLELLFHQLSFHIPYRGKFSQGPNFRDFHDPRPKHKNKNSKNFTNFCVNIFEHVFFFHACVLCTSSVDLTTVLYLFTPADNILFSLTCRTSSVPVILATIKGHDQ